MKIKRIINNQEIEIELTPAEIRNAYEEYHLGCIKEDILSEYTCDDEDLLDRAASAADRYLDKNDYFWEMYFECLRDAAKDSGMEKLEME